MADVRVTREHRERAALYVRCAEPGDYVPAKWAIWIDTGECPESVFSGAIERAEELARYDAEAEQRGYQRCQNDVVAWLRACVGVVAPADRGDACAVLERAIGVIASGQHIGASDSVPSGQEGE